MYNLLKVIKEHDKKEVLMPSIRKWITKENLTNISISKIQRHFRIGYNRAAIIHEMLKKEDVPVKTP
ncbi:hypothetical protein DXF93_16275 [Escherichia coli]|nr:hypothetical protein DXF93_16275 [Escherichia coli]